VETVGSRQFRKKNRIVRCRDTTKKVVKKGPGREGQRRGESYKRERDNSISQGHPPERAMCQEGGEFHESKILREGGNL